MAFAFKVENIIYMLSDTVISRDICLFISKKIVYMYPGKEIQYILKNIIHKNDSKACVYDKVKTVLCTYKGMLHS